MKEVTKYVCDHCKREYKKEINAINHEKICWKNLKLKTCVTCKYFDGWDYDYNEFSSDRYIICTEYPDLPSDDKPVLNCEYWVKRVKE